MEENKKKAEISDLPDPVRRAQTSAGREAGASGHEIPDLPDESEYPRELTEKYELMECLADKAETRTLLAVDREDGSQCVVKCYLRMSALYDRTEPEVLRKVLWKPEDGPSPRFIAEYMNGEMRCVLREYVPGDTLSELAERRSFSEKDVPEIGLQLCDQLDVLHSMDPPVIHRDIKPQNVVIRPDGKAVLIDYGIARVQSDNETDTVAFGTQGFAPPEQYGYSQTDARSDIYSLGVLLNWLLYRDTKITGRGASASGRGASASGKGSARSGVSAPEKGAERGGSSALDKVIARCAAFDPQKRYGDVRQVKRALVAARPEERGKRGVLYFAAAVLVAVLAVAGLTAAVRGRRARVSFQEPLVEQAVRMNLGLEEQTPVTQDMLAQVTGIYIVADAAYPDADEFYPAISRWYAEGNKVHGTLRTLEDLAGMPEIAQVCVVAEELKSLAPLEGLGKLNKVECKHNYITDINVLAGMDRLTSVGINDNPVEDLSPLTKCPNLAFLDLCGVRNYDPAVIDELGNFDLLDISNPTSSYEHLAGKRILDLRVAWTGLRDLHVLDEVSHLERLEIDHTDVTDLAPLAVHTGLKVLKISELPVTDLSVLLQLPQLEEVIISEDMRPAAEALGDVPFTVRVE